MRHSHAGNNPLGSHPLRDERLTGLRWALAQFEMPASDGVFDDLLRRLAAIDVPRQAAPGTNIRPAVRGARLLPRRRATPWRSLRAVGAR